MRSIPWIFALSALLTLTTGCARKDATASAAATDHTSTNGPIKIGFLVKQPEEAWFQYEQKSAEETGAKLGFSVIKLGTQDSEKVMRAIDNIAVDGAQGFVICTPDVQLGPATMTKADEDRWVAEMVRRMERRSKIMCVFIAGTPTAYLHRKSSPLA